MEPPSYPVYPIFLELAGRLCVVVGGGPFAEEKARGLLAAGAVVTVIAPEVAPGLAGLAAAGRLEHRARGFQAADLDGACLAFLCAQPPEVVAAVRHEARRRGVLVNTVDDPPHCDFIMPSVVRRGDLAIAVSTHGKAPALAVRLRERLEREIGDEHALFLRWAGSVRGELAAQRPDFAERREAWYRLVDSDVLALLRAGDEAGAARRFAEILGVEPA